MFDFFKAMVEDEIGMHKEDNEELFNSVYQQMTGRSYQVDDEIDNDEQNDDFLSNLDLSDESEDEY